jgi:mono/diheme cytochrome c family protein
LRIDMATGQIEGLRLGAGLPHPAFAARPSPALRLAGGDWLERLDMSGLEKGWGTLRLVLRDDSGALAAALRTLAGGAPWQALLDGRPVPGEALLEALLAELGAGRPSMPVPVLPPPQLELPVALPAAEAGGVAPALAAFHAWCAACHWTAETFPPNFLHGPADTLEARLRQCAPRIYVRLAMAGVPRAQRAKTPMPPETLLPAFGTHAEAWARGPERAALEATIRRLLAAESGREPDLPTLLAGGYEALRPCLAPARP